MKERIYTIPINEAFDNDSECPICICERKLENDALEYAIGPAMMEPDNRIETNKKGFCANHFAKLYNFEKNRLPLALVIDTHMVEQIKEIEDIFKGYGLSSGDENKGPLKAFKNAFFGMKQDGKAIDQLVEKLESLEKTCAVCDKIEHNLDKLIENTLYLYSKEPEFKKKFINSKGFCLKHFKMLLKKAPKTLSASSMTEFIDDIVPLQLKALKRVQEDVNHFTKMFDYRNQNADWKNSKDAVPRSIEKLSGPCDLKR